MTRILSILVGLITVLPVHQAQAGASFVLGGPYGGLYVVRNEREAAIEAGVQAKIQAISRLEKVIAGVVGETPGTVRQVVNEWNLAVYVDQIYDSDAPFPQVVVSLVNLVANRFDLTIENPRFPAFNRDRKVEYLESAVATVLTELDNARIRFAEPAGDRCERLLNKRRMVYL